MGIIYKDVCDVIKSVMKTSEFMDAQNRYIALNTDIDNAVYKVDVPLEFKNLGVYSIEFSNIYYSIFYEINGAQNYLFNLNVDTSFFKLNQCFETESSEYNLFTYKITIKTINRNITSLDTSNYKIGRIVLEKGLKFSFMSFKMDKFLPIASNNESLACLDYLDNSEAVLDNTVPSYTDYYYFYNIFNRCTFYISNILSFFKHYINYGDEGYLNILLYNNCKVKLGKIEIGFIQKYIYLLSKYQKLFDNIANMDNTFIYILKYHPSISLNSLFELYSKDKSSKKLFKYFNLQFLILDTIEDYDALVISIDKLRNENIFKNISIKIMKYEELIDKEVMLRSND